ncbi:UNVERIFIED_CONTAM: hypothetical protein Slati_2236000 [Sesamum latifolium]|uniref:Reverse transcriptase/retrotransposon-derived protein RNase H-like domain-containing protein n=1 Tax=Sesamum latifolium TaxID=2727402 RepID=A0AAW2WUN1_9LAMI
MRKVKDFEWDASCQQAFEELKNYLAKLPLLVKPCQGDTLCLYLTTTPQAIPRSGVPLDEIEVEVAADSAKVAVEGAGVPLAEVVFVAPREEIEFIKPHDMDGVEVAADACGSEMGRPDSGRVNTATSPGSQIAGTGGPGYEAAANTTTYLGSQIAGHDDRAMAFILPKTIIREIEKQLRSFLWKGSNGGDMQKFHGNRLHTHSVWTVSDRTVSWGWRKLIRLRGMLQPFIEYKIGSGSSFSLWYDPWHELGPLILRFPMGPRHTDTLPIASLNTIILEGSWCWPPITNMESVEITHSLPIIYGGEDQIIWTAQGGTFSPASAYAIFPPPGPTVVFTTVRHFQDSSASLHSLAGHSWETVYFR